MFLGIIVFVGAIALLTAVVVNYWCEDLMVNLDETE